MKRYLSLIFALLMIGVGPANAQFVLKQSTAAHVMVVLVATSDHIAGLASATLTITASKNGGAFASTTPTVTDRGSGWYDIALSTTDTNTTGPLALHITATSADPLDVIYQVVTYDPYDSVRLGLTALPNAAAAASGGLPTVDGSNAVKVQSGTGANQISLSSGLVTVGTNNDKTGYTASTVSDKTGYTVSTVSDKTGYSLATLDSTVLHSGTAQAGASSTITLASGASSTDNFYVGNVVKIYGGTGIGQSRLINAYVGSTRVATISRGWVVNPDNTSTYAVLQEIEPSINSGLQVTAASVQGNVTGNVQGSTASIATGGITSASFASGAIDATAIATDAIGAAEIAADAIGASELATDAIGASEIAASAIGASEIADASIDAATFAAGAIDASAIATDAIGAAEIAADAIGASELATDAIGSSEVAAGAVTEIQSGLSTLTAANVWDLATSGHTTSGTFGAAAVAAGGAGDPWSTSLPGSYGAGTAGYIVGTNLDALISSRMATFTLPTNFSSLAITGGGAVTVGTNNDKTGYTASTVSDKTGYSLSVTPPTANQVRDAILTDSTPFAGADVASIKTTATANSTDLGTLLGRLTALRAGYLNNLSAGAVALDSTVAKEATLSTVAGYVDTEVGAIKTVTDHLATALELDGSVYRYTSNALEQAPTGGAGTAPTVEEIDAQLSGTHGSGAWGSAGASGANTVNLTVSNGSAGVPNAVVTIYGSDGVTLVDQKHTGTSGTVAFSLDTASYKVSVGAVPGYSSLAVQTLSVSTNPQAATYTLSAIIPATPSSGLARTVYGYLYGPDGQPQAGKQVKATLSDKKVAAANGALLSHATLSTTTDVTGLWQLSLIVGANFTKGVGQFVITAGSDTFGPFTVPAGSGGVNVESLIR